MPAAWARLYNSADVRSDRLSGSARVPWLGSPLERSALTVAALGDWSSPPSLLKAISE